MNTPKHTPGPWRYFKQHNPKPEFTTTFHIDSKTRGHMAVLTVYDLNSSPKWREANQEAVREYEETMEEVEANARLIAAAPELLEALQDTLWRCEGEGWSEPETRKMRDAIQKATQP